MIPIPMRSSLKRSLAAFAWPHFISAVPPASISKNRGKPAMFFSRIDLERRSVTLRIRERDMLPDANAIWTFFVLSRDHKLFNAERHRSITNELKALGVSAAGFNQWWVPSIEFAAGGAVVIGLLAPLAALELLAREVTALSQNPGLLLYAPHLRSWVARGSTPWEEGYSPPAAIGTKSAVVPRFASTYRLPVPG